MRNILVSLLVSKILNTNVFQKPSNIFILKPQGSEQQNFRETENDICGV
jgi:hypothetical protein